jgi:hypothetical protein
MTKLTDEEEITRQAYDTHGKAWAAARSTNYWDTELDKFYKLLPKGSVLEIGAGHGRDAN